MSKQNKRKRSYKKNPTSAQPLTFFIDAMDTLGQGIYRSEDGIYFIAKTLPGETGRARIISRKKGVHFAKVESLDQEADNRISPDCSHYKQCPGCDYLHTDYSSELAYKQAALQQHFYGVEIPDIEVFQSPSRYGYRNRVQLHYRGNQLGLLDGASNRIIEIPNCLLPDPALQQAVKDLYQQRSWLEQKSKRGHCELALIDGQVQIFWNKPYAYGGFSQVNCAVNQRLCTLVEQHIATSNTNTLLDLFSGDGNLSKAIIAQQNISGKMVDFGDYQNPDFIRLDLFDQQSLPAFIEQSQWQEVDTLLVDPPRKGFAHLPQWVSQLKPKQLIYVSCHAATMVRDIKNIQQPFRIQHVQLLDMFPGTKHFETLLVLEFV